MQTEAKERAVEATEAPSERPRTSLDVRTLGPPKPLTRTLETLAELDGETVLVQINDREPKHLFPKLADRGYEYATLSEDDAVLTAIWQRE